MNTTILLDIVELLEKCQTKSAFQEVRSQFPDHIQTVWDDWLTDDFKKKVLALCR